MRSNTYLKSQVKLVNAEVTFKEVSLNMANVEFTYLFIPVFT